MTYKFKQSFLSKIKHNSPQWFKNLVKMEEYCDKCGITQPLCWTCDSDELWEEINGTSNGALCPKCFWELCYNKGIFITFYAKISHEKDVNNEWKLISE